MSSILFNVYKMGRTDQQGEINTLSLTDDFEGGHVVLTVMPQQENQVVRVDWHEDGPHLKHVVRDFDRSSSDVERRLKDKIREACACLFEKINSPVEKTPEISDRSLVSGIDVFEMADKFLAKIKADKKFKTSDEGGHLFEMGRLILRSNHSMQAVSVELRSEDDAYEPATLKLICNPRGQNQEITSFLCPDDNEPIDLSKELNLGNIAHRKFKRALLQAVFDLEKERQLANCRSELRAAMLAHHMLCRDRDEIERDLESF